MILSVSRRCDIPAFFGKWFLNRLKEGFVCVRNPYNRHSVSKILLGSQTVDCIVFWTKNAAPFLQYLPQIDDLGYRYYFQFTVTPYGKEIEKNVGDKEKIIQTFHTLSDKIGKECAVWRYDPILLASGISVDWHIKSSTRRNSARRMRKKCSRSERHLPKSQRNTVYISKPARRRSQFWGSKRVPVLIKRLSSAFAGRSQ